MKKIISFVSALIAFALFAVTACAHATKSTVEHNPQYTKWDIFEPPDNTGVGLWRCQSADNNITVGFGDLSPLQEQDLGTFKTYIGYAIGRWKRAGSINMKLSNNPVVRINAYSDSSDANWGYNDFRNSLVIDVGDGGQHFVSLDIYVNVASTKVPVSNETRSKHVMAHELGHAIGLADLTVNNSDTTYSNYLMGRNNYSITTPTTADVKGATVILGMHTSHSFNTYYNHNDNQHRKTCSTCDGYVLESHTKVNGVCTKCNQ